MVADILTNVTLYEESPHVTKLIEHHPDKEEALKVAENNYKDDSKENEATDGLIASNNKPIEHDNTTDDSKCENEEEDHRGDSKEDSGSRLTCEAVRALFHAICEGRSNEAATILLRNTPMDFIHCSNALTGARRHLFVLKNVHVDDLYWYEEYAAYLSRQKFYVGMSLMSNGDVLLSVLMTRCNRPRCDLMIYSCEDGKVHVVHESEYHQQHPDVHLEPDIPFDVEKYQG